MVAFGVTGLAAASLLLVWSGLDHSRGRAALHAALIVHRILPYGWTRFGAQVLGPLEIGLGLSSLVILLSWPDGVRLVGPAVAAMYAAFAVYAITQMRVAPDAVCGCFADATRASWMVVTRSAVLCLMAVLLAVDSGKTLGPTELGLGLVAAVPLTILLRYLPTLHNLERGAVNLA